MQVFSPSLLTEPVVFKYFLYWIEKFMFRLSIFEKWRLEFDFSKYKKGKNFRVAEQYTHLAKNYHKLK